MATLGKMVGGSIGGSGAIVARREIMECGNPKARPREYVFTAGTFSGNPLNSAAGYAALDVIDRAEGALNRHANGLGERFRDGMNKVFERHDFPAQAAGCCTTNGVAFTEKLQIKSAYDFEKRNDTEKLYKWHMYLATRHGIYTYPGSGAIFLTAMHTEEDIDRLVASTEEFVKTELA
jgi:glutamate-1-semialdehyde 2,1-aminomutase